LLLVAGGLLQATKYGAKVGKEYDNLPSLVQVNRSSIGNHCAAEGMECPIQLEAVLAAPHGITEDNPNRIDPDKGSPLIMSFQEFYGLNGGQIHRSRLGEIPEDFYRSSDVDRARYEKIPFHREPQAGPNDL